MTIVLLCLALIIAAAAWRASRVPFQHRWRRRQARVVGDALCGPDRGQSPAPINARLRAMDALAFEELLLDSFLRGGHRVVRNRRYTGDGGIDGLIVIGGPLTTGDRITVRKQLWLNATLLIALTSSPAVASVNAPGSGDEEQLIARCIRQSARGKPWLEKALWGIRGQEGGWIGTEVRNSDGSHDLGPMQINSWWIPRIARLVGRDPDEVRQWLRYDGCFNVEAARWVLLGELARTRKFWSAIGAFHSPRPGRAARYARGIYWQIQLHPRELRARR